MFGNLIASVDDSRPIRLTVCFSAVCYRVRFANSFSKISGTGTHSRIAFSFTSITCLAPTFTYAFATVKPGIRSPNSL